MTEADKNYMALALELAERGAGWTSPNPMVGAVIVKDGAIIGQGYHARCGDLHAERAALKNCTGDPAGGTLYVTLEPCCHQGRQPPCTDAILQAGIARVVVGSPDPNPLVAGKGVQILRDHGVQVEEGVLRTECDRLNRVFLKYIQTGRPYVIMKYAMTLDGKIAAYTGASQWVTGEEARAHVQTLRHRCRAILVGVGTVIADDPRLTCRLPGGRDPIRVICDTRLRTPLTAQVVTSAGQTPTWIATCCAAPERLAPYERAGCKMLVLPERAGRVDLNALMDCLGRQEVDSILLEGGGTLNWSALDQGVVDGVMAYVAPKLFGGRTAKTPVEGRGVDAPAAAFPLKNTTITQIGADFLLESEVDRDVYRHH